MRIGSGEGSTTKNFIVCTVHLLTAIKFIRLKSPCHVARMGSFRILICETTEKTLLGRPKHR